MSDIRKFYKTVIKVTVLTEDEPPENYSLSDIDYLITEGRGSGQVEVVEQIELDPKKMAKLLMEQGSSTEFFDLDGDGTDLRGENLR